MMSFAQGLNDYKYTVFNSTLQLANQKLISSFNIKSLSYRCQI